MVGITLPKFVSWTKLENKFYKFNSDGSSFGNPGMSHGGGVIWNNKGDIIIGYARSYGMRTNNCIELRVELDGLSLCKTTEIFNLEVE